MLTSCDCEKRDTGLKWLLYAQSTGLLGAEGIEYAEYRGVKLKEHRGDTHTHTLSHTHTPPLAHSSDSLILSPQMNMLNAGKKLSTGKNTHTLTSPPQMSLAISAQIFVLNDGCPGATAA